jgi:O-antigen ligase
MRSAAPVAHVTREDAPTAPVAWILVALAVVSPWPFGSASHFATAAISLIAGTATCATGVLLRARMRVLPTVPFVWPLVGLLALALLQLTPLPFRLQAVLAPGPARIWHPAEPAAAESLGPGPRPLSIQPTATARALAFATSVVALSVLAASALSRRRVAAQAAVAVAASGCAAALFGIVSHLVFGNRLYGWLAVPTVAPYGSFVSKNHFAGYVEMATLLTLGLAVGLAAETHRGSSPLSWIESRSAWRVLLAFAAAATMALAVLVSQSRGGALALGTALVAFFLLQRPRDTNRGSPLVGLGACAAVVLLAFLVLPRASQERLRGLRHAGTDAAGSFRLAVWRDALRASSASPILGWGMDSFADALPPYKTSSGELRVEHAENDYLELLTEGGLLALGLAITAVALWARGAISCRSVEGSRLHASVSAGAASGVVALLVHGLVDFNLHVTSNALLFSLLVALCAGWQLRSTTTTRVPLAAVSVAGGAAVLLGGFLVMSRERPDLAALRGRPINTLRSVQVESELIAYLRTRPADAEAWVLLGWLRQRTGDHLTGGALARYGAQLDPRRDQLKTLVGDPSSVRD